MENQSFQEREFEIEKKKKRNKIILYGFGTGIVLGGGYLLYNHFQNQAAKRRALLSQPLPATTQVKQIIQVNKTSFPISKGMRGELVRMIQTALLALGGKAAETIKSTSIGKGGKPDGIFGNGTQRALVAAGYPPPLSEEDFKELIAKGKSKQATSTNAKTAFVSKSIADEIKAAIKARNVLKVEQALKKINGVEQYKQVSSHFFNYEVNNITVTTLVNALLSVAFRFNEAAKTIFRREFERMNLVERDGKWFLSGFDSLGSISKDLFRLAVTRKPTLLKNGSGNFVLPKIEAGKTIGYVTASHRGVMQLFTKNGQVVYAPSHNIKLI